MACVNSRSTKPALGPLVCLGLTGADWLAEPLRRERLDLVEKRLVGENGLLTHFL